MASNLVPSGKRSRWSRRPMSEINVTPMVDVMLVLLVIFMVTAPLMVSGISVDLPKAQSSALPQEQDPIQISITKNRDIFVNQNRVSIHNLPGAIRRAAKGRSEDPRLYIRASEKLVYGYVIQVVSRITRAGFKKIALVTQVEDNSDDDQNKSTG